MASNPDTPGGPVTDTYGSGLVNQTDNTGTTYYTRDPSGALISQRLPNGTAYHYLVDDEGSVVKVVDGSGTAVATYFYCPTGNYADPPTGSDAAQPWQHWGLYYEAGDKTYRLGDQRLDPDSGNTSQPQFCLLFGGIFGFFCPRTAPVTTGQQAQAPDPTIFRVQLQASPVSGGTTIFTDARVLSDDASGRGVTARQVRDALLDLGQFVPNSIWGDYYNVVVKISMFLSEVVAGGGWQGKQSRSFPFATQNRQVWRVDLENLRGWNLRYEG